MTAYDRNSFHKSSPEETESGKKELRVLEVIGGAIKKRGQDGFVLSLVENLDMEGLHVDCLVPYDCPFESYRECLRRKGVVLYELGIPYDPKRTVNEIYRPFLGFLKTHSYDIVHIHSSKTTMMAMMATAAKKTGERKVIVHAHNGGSGRSMRHILLRCLGNIFMHRQVDLYCACSRSAAEWKFAGQHAENAVIVKNGIETERFQFRPDIRDSIRNKLNIPEGCFVTGNVGSLTPQKNQGFLISVFEKIAAIEENTRLLLVGDGEDRNDLEKLVLERGLTGRVIIAGNVSNVEDYLQAMDVFVFPSIFEGLGTAAIEAQAAGLPVVASAYVPREAAVSQNVAFLPLSAGSDKWVKTILSFRGYKRSDGTSCVAGAGYDIRQTTAGLKEIYHRLYSGTVY